MTKNQQELVVPTYSAAQVREAEAPYLDSDVPLMERASHALAEVIFEHLDWSSEYGDPRILVLVGSGNNGGDALFAAAELAERGAQVVAVTTADKTHEEGTAAAHATGVRFVDEDGFDQLDLGGLPFDVIIDGILGIGTSPDPALRGRSREVVEMVLSELDSAVTKVFAVDIPSGLQPDTGASDGVVIPAYVTVTFGGVKQGLVAEETKPLVGNLVLVDIGITDELQKLTPTGEATVREVIDAVAI